MPTTPPIVIIVEPSAMISDVLRVEFSCLGFAVLLAANAKEAEQYATQAVASLVVLDVTEMKLSGYEACARIRRHSGYATRPIVMTASQVSPQDTAAAEKAGATVLLAKPYSMSDLIRAVSPHLPAGDPLLTLPCKGRTTAGTTHEWKLGPKPDWHFGADSGLSRNGSILNVVRGVGARIPLIRKP
jgi:DNA-binding response OmpR family regulator